MEFENKIPEWKNAGAEPSEELKTKGFLAGYKPSANIFNWFFSIVQKAITELQTKFKTSENAVGNKVDKAEGLGLMGFGSSTSDGKTWKNIMVMDSKTGVPTIEKLPAYTSDLVNDSGYLDDKKAVTIAQGGTGATTAEKARANLGAASVFDMIVGVNDLDWVFDDGFGCYWYGAFIPEIFSDDTPIVDVCLAPDDPDGNQIMLEAWACVQHIEVDEGLLVLYTDGAQCPAVAFNMQVKVVR